MNLIFQYIGNVIIPTDELHHFSEGWLKTTNQIAFESLGLERRMERQGILSEHLSNPTLTSLDVGEQWECLVLKHLGLPPILGCLGFVVSKVCRTFWSRFWEQMKEKNWNWHSIHVPGPIASLSGMRRALHLVACEILATRHPKPLPCIGSLLR